MYWGKPIARLGKFAEAEEALKRGLRLKPDSARARCSLGWTAADFANRGGGEESERLKGLNPTREAVCWYPVTAPAGARLKELAR